MSKSGSFNIKCASWNIDGKYQLFKLPALQTFIERFDVLFLTETHMISTCTVNFKSYEYPDTSCNYEYPRGGTCVLIKKEFQKFIKNVKLVMTDVVEVVFTNKACLINLYIPPLDSPYYNEQYVEILCSWFHEAEKGDTALLALGDFNARFGELNTINELFSYNDNEDNTMNQNGKHIKELLFNTSSAIPLNHLKVGNYAFDGGYTFSRNERKSQIDWCIVNKYSLPITEDFKIARDCPSISDHKLIFALFRIEGESSLDSLLRGANDMNILSMNHSKVPTIDKNNTNLNILNNLLKTEIQKTNFTGMTSHRIAKFLTNNIRKFGKIARIPYRKRYIATNNDNRSSHFDRILEKRELDTWKFVKETNDMKGLWNAINMKGEFKKTSDIQLDVDELAYICNNKSKIDVSQTSYNDLETDVVNDDLDKQITDVEIENAVKKLHESKTSDGIASSTVKHILSTLMPILIMLYNIIFTSGKKGYPSSWINFVNGIPKKGKLDPPLYVRFITIMGIFEKIYQSILSNRLYTFLKFPSQQTAYQTGKSCSLHVMTIRLLKILAKKTQKKLYIIFTDFEAAFDLVSRRLLFEKLIKLGVSSVMISALIAMYLASKSVVENGAQYSDYLILLAGVKQGAPPSGILYIAYTMSLIDIFSTTFQPEPLISIFHFLMHADDILMLSTARAIAIKKVKCLIQYCKENFIRLQIKKCAVMCVNGEEEDTQPIIIDELILKPTNSEAYLGSIITNSYKLIDDVNADIKNRQVNVIKFFAFLRNNRNAPVNVKLKVLNACILSSLLYNSETWSNVNINRLEILHRRMLRAILGIGSRTCNEIVYIELGITSLQTHITIKQFEFWKKVINMNDDNPLKYVIKEAKKAKVNEIIHYENIYKKYKSKEDIVEEFFNDVRKRIKDKANQGRSKYVTYLSINPELSFPCCYNEAKYRHVSMVAKLRSSSHSLRVETGRKLGLNRENRLCLCGLDVEDEAHFLLNCCFYVDIRTKYSINDLSLDEILSSERFMIYIEELMERRKSLQ